MRFGTRWSAAYGFPQESIADVLAELEREGRLSSNDPSEVLSRLESVVLELAEDVRFDEFDCEPFGAEYGDVPESADRVGGGVAVIP